MPVAKLTCPECEAVLRPAKPLPAGKNVKCPKCGVNFKVRDEEDEFRNRPPAGRDKAAPAAAAKAPVDDDDDEVGTYRFAEEPPPPKQEEEDDEDFEDEDDDGRPRKSGKARALADELVPDLSVKDPRGPAQAAINSPSNMLMMIGFLGCVLALGDIVWCIWPMVFSEHMGLDAGELLKASNDLQTIQKGQEVNKKQGAPQKEWKDLTKDELNQIEPLETAYLIWNLIWLGGGIFLFLYNGLIVFGAVKMQNLESYGWSMAASIMAMVPFTFPLLGFLVGLLGISTLRSSKVRAGFEYRGDFRTPATRKRDPRASNKL